MADNEQTIGKGAAGYQAGANLTVNHGMTADQMAEIMVALSGQLSAFLDQARTTQEQRFSELRKAIVDEFIRPGTEAKADAFSDPDFQYVVQEAHETYARNGTETLRDELVRLIAERSHRPPSSRISNILNAAIPISGRMGEEEFSSLVAIFLINSVVVGMPSVDLIIKQHSSLLEPFIETLPSGGGSMEYLSTLGCITMNSVMTRALDAQLVGKYAHSMSDGFTQEALTAAISDSISDGILEDAIDLTSILQGLLYKEGGMLRFYSGSDEDFKIRLEQRGVQGKLLNGLSALRVSHKATKEVVLQKFREGIPQFHKLEEFWNTSGAQRADITMLGKAVAHSALAGRAKLRAPLEIWVN